MHQHQHAELAQARRMAFRAGWRPTERPLVFAIRFALYCHYGWEP